MFKSHDNTTVSAAILCPAVCISDVIKKAGMCGRCMNTVIRQVVFPALHRKKKRKRKKKGGGGGGGKKKKGKKEKKKETNTAVP